MSDALLVADPLQQPRVEGLYLACAPVAKEERLHPRHVLSQNSLTQPEFGKVISDFGITVKLAYVLSMPSQSKAPSRRRLLHLLRQVRLDAGLRQADLASKLGQPQSFISKYECGERRLDILELRAICAAVGVSLSEFVRRLEGERS